LSTIGVFFPKTLVIPNVYTLAESASRTVSPGVVPVRRGKVFVKWALWAAQFASGVQCSVLAGEDWGALADDAERSFAVAVVYQHTRRCIGA
jgi:hypothetical protein